MVVIHRVSTAPLSAYIDYLWLADGYQQPHAEEFVLPTGNMTLVVDLDVHTADAMVIGGVRSRPLVLSTSKRRRLLAAHFKPGGGFPFVNCPAGELHNLQAPMAAFWPSASGQLLERIHEAKTNRERFRALECFLLQRLRSSRTRSAAVGYALRQFEKAGAACAVRTVRAQIGMSAQRFIGLFHREVGVAPKAFARLARFSRAVRRIDMAAEIDWADIAVATGYYDQPHFIHDFHHFAGMSPTAYLRQRVSQNHVRITA